MAFQRIIPARLGQAAITTTIATVYTCPASTRVLLKCFDLCNTTASAKTVDVHLVPSGGSATADNALMFGVAVGANTTLQWSGTQVLASGDTIRVKASATGVTITASGGEAT